MLASHRKRPSRPRPNYFFLFWVLPIMILFRLGLAFLDVLVASGCRDGISHSFFARVQFFLFLSKTPWRWEVKSRKFQLVPLTIGGEIAKILSSSIDDSLSTWIGLLNGTRIRTLVNLLYLGIMDNRWNFFNFETLETHCNLIFNRIKSFLEY